MHTPFDFYTYLSERLVKNLLFQREGFALTTCSGINHLEGILEQMRRTAHFVCVSDVTDGSTFRESGGWFQRRVVEIFIVLRYRQGDRAHQLEQLTTARTLLRQIQSCIIHDEGYLQATHNLYLHLDSFPTTELGGIFLAGATGVTLSLAIDEPTNLCFNPTEWGN